jgi:hypothetical protein
MISSQHNNDLLTSYTNIKSQKAVKSPQQSLKNETTIPKLTATGCRSCVQRKKRTACKALLRQSRQGQNNAKKLGLIGQYFASLKKPVPIKQKVRNIRKMGVPNNRPASPSELSRYISSLFSLT